MFYFPHAKIAQHLKIFHCVQMIFCRQIHNLLFENNSRECFIELGRVANNHTAVSKQVSDAFCVSYTPAVAACTQQRSRIERVLPTWRCTQQSSRRSPVTVACCWHSTGSDQASVVRLSVLDHSIHSLDSNLKVVWKFRRGSMHRDTINGGVGENCEFAGIAHYRVYLGNNTSWH